MSQNNFLNTIKTGDILICNKVLPYLWDEFDHISTLSSGTFLTMIDTANGIPYELMNGGNGNASSKVIDQYVTVLIEGQLFELRKGYFSEKYFERVI
jgi:hypothetical protein